MSTVHNFATSLRRSETQVDAAWWEAVYRKAFPTMAAMVSIRQDGWAQRGGIDRIIILASGKEIKIDEKIRQRDFNDVLLEYWSNTERRIPGWIAKDLACDFVAYTYLETQRCFLLPFLLLRRAWKQHGQDWIARAERQEEGFQKVVARNKAFVGNGLKSSAEARKNQGYTTTSVAISWNVLSEALTDAMVICFSPETLVIPHGEEPTTETTYVKQ